MQGENNIVAEADKHEPPHVEIRMKSKKLSRLFRGQGAGSFEFLLQREEDRFKVRQDVAKQDAPDFDEARDEFLVGVREERKVETQHSRIEEVADVV